VSLSLAPFPGCQRHTFAAGGTVYPAEYRELVVVTPAGARVELCQTLVRWAGAGRVFRSTAREVLDLARAGASGFRLGRVAFA
jgi:hypothetical protein